MANEGEEKKAEGAEEAVVAEALPSVILRQEIVVDGEPTKKLQFREPTGADIEKYGLPVIINFGVNPVQVTFDEAKMTKMISALGGVTLKSVQNMKPRDWTNCAWAITPFFMPDL